MKVSARFNEHGLELVLKAESAPEKSMVGAVLNQPFDEAHSVLGYMDAGSRIAEELLAATVHFEGHWTDKTVEALVVRVHRQEGHGRGDAKQKEEAERLLRSWLALHENPGACNAAAIAFSTTQYLAEKS